jgi:hypothetical protein
VVTYLRLETNKYHVAHPKAKQHISKFFHYIKVENIDKSRHLDCLIVKESCSKHQVCYLSSNNPSLYQYHQLFYFYVNCIDGSPKSDCVNREHVLEWTLTRLRPKNRLEVWEMMYDSNEEIEAGIGSEWNNTYFNWWAILVLICQ